MKVANGHIILYADNDFLRRFVEDEFPNLNIELFPLSAYNKSSKVMQNAILLLDFDSKVLINDLTINKPLSAIDLTRIVNNQLILCQSSSIKIGNFNFSPSQKVVTGNGQIICLTDKEAELLAYLLRSGDLVNRDELLKQIWGYNNEIETKTLETHIYKLKQKLPVLKDLIIRKNMDYKIISS